MMLRSPSKRDAILILAGAVCTHLLTILAPFAPQAIVISHSLKGQVILEHPVQYDQVSDSLLEADILGDDIRLSEEHVSSSKPAETTLVEHVPGWTVFRDIYMFNGTLLIVSSSPSSFPEIRYMTSTGLAADVTPDNIAAREPTKWNMDFLKIISVEGNTLLFNDPPQFLAHYYHFCAELLLGTWSFWTGAAHPKPPPPIHRAIFPHSSAAGWRDHPGFNSYFLRAAFPSLTVEVDIDWQDRVVATAESDVDQAWHFPYLLLADRSAAFRGRLCGSANQRTASESVDGLIARSKLDIGGLWWRPIRSAVWHFAGATENGEPLDEHELEALVARKNAEAMLTEGKEWVLNIVGAETLTKNEQVRLASQTNVLLGVHGNGLSHLILMPRTRFSAARALGLKHFGMWNDTYFTEENTPKGPNIPIYGPTEQP
ncbi:hypothetical protein BKA83DRAFT_4282540 [Pisolithus microcarpus]|nr:hypothetical protein BKA83DRAFT_4282540 [Pisolithus microcarpus]